MTSQFFKFFLGVKEVVDRTSPFNAHTHITYTYTHLHLHTPPHPQPLRTMCRVSMFGIGVLTAVAATPVRGKKVIGTLDCEVSYEL